MRKLAAAAALLLASCYEPGGQCTVDEDCMEDQVCGADALCVPGTRPPPGDAPVARSDAYDFQGSGPFDVAAATGVLADDSTGSSGRSIAAELVANASYGVVYLAPDGSFTYAPVLGFLGADAFSYRATDGVLSSDPTTVTITVAAGPPIAQADAYGARQDVPLVVAAAGVLANDASDPPGRALGAVLVANAAHGTVALAADGGFTYTPAAGYFGPDAFTYRATEGTLSSAPTTVSIAVAPPPPVAQADAYAVVQDVALAVAAPGVLANDTDPSGGTLAAALVANAAHGQVVLASDGGFTYTPDPGYAGPDAFTYRATSAAGTSDPTTVTLTVAP